MKAPHYSFMKYWRVVRKYALMKYNLSQEDLDVLFYIHDEKYFSNYKFEEYEKLLSWDTKRLTSLSERGWISKLAPGNKYAQRDVYEVTMKTQRVVTNIYKILNGDGYPTISQRLTRTHRRFLEKRYKRFIISLVEELKESKKKQAEIAAANEAERLRNERVRRLRGQ
jgi:hypothetical protein